MTLAEVNPPRTKLPGYINANFHGVSNTRMLLQKCALTKNQECGSYSKTAEKLVTCSVTEFKNLSDSVLSVHLQVQMVNERCFDLQSLLEILS